MIDLGGRLTLRQLGTVLAGADAVVCGNTGPMHLAAAVGTPVVAAFAPTVPLARWRPWRVPHVVLGDQDVPCAGCRSRVCPLDEQVCLASVTGADVVAALDRLAPARTRRRRWWRREDRSRVELVSEHASPLAALGDADAGGQNVHVAALAAHLAGLGCEVTVSTRADAPDLPARVRMAPGVAVEHVRAGPAGAGGQGRAVAAHARLRPGAAPPVGRPPARRRPRPLLDVGVGRARGRPGAARPAAGASRRSTPSAW